MKSLALQTKTIDNYGSCLQAFALYKTLKKLKVKVDILPFARYNFEKTAIHNFCLLFIYTLLKRKYKYLCKLEKLKMHLLFCKFRKKYLNLNSNKLTRDKNYFKSTNKIYDIFVVGSDVLWNPNNRYDNFYYDMLKFTNDEKNRVAYAPSFGITKFPPYLINEVKPFLLRFNCLSCREDEGIMLLNRDFGLKATQVLDPTFFLCKNDWIKLSKNKYKLNKKSFVIYAFNNFPIYELVNKLLRESELDIDIIPLYNEFDKRLYKNKRVHKHIANCGPLEFVSLILNAQCVFSNGFHAIALAINFNVPFIALNRDSDNEGKSVNSRIRSILNVFNLNNRLYTFDQMLSCNLTNIVKLDFKKINSIIKHKKNESLKFLSDAIK